MPSPFPPDDPRAFRLLVDDYANHASAIETVARMGRGAIVPLERYLAQGPQVNPQGRLFAISMLTRFPLSKVLDSLRGVLHGTRLHDLPPSQQDAERQVKSAVLDHLAAHDYPQKAADIAFGVQSERLTAAVQAAGRLKMVELGPELVQLLEDDVLERVASEALTQMGEAGALTILAALPKLFHRSSDNVRGRLALIRALLSLVRLDGSIPSWAEQRASCSHPAVSAAAALLAKGSPDRSLTERLVHGALSDQAELASRCHTQLEKEGGLSADMAEQVLRLGVEPDIYGNPAPLQWKDRLWLARLRQAPS